MGIAVFKAFFVTFNTLSGILKKHYNYLRLQIERNRECTINFLIVITIVETIVKLYR